MISKKDAAYFLAFLVLFIFLFRELVLTSETFFVRDVTRLEVPSRLHCTQLLKEGDFALWTDAFGNGQPFLANPKNAVFYPTTWLFLILPFFLAFKFHYVFHIVSAYLGIYYLSRSYNLSRRASFLAASLFLAGGPYLSSLEFYNHIAALAWLPWILLGQRISYRLTAMRIIVPAGFWTLSVLSGTPEITLITIVLALLQTLFLNQEKWRGLARLLLPLVFAVLISSVQVLPTLEFWKNSVRRTVHSSEWPLEVIQLLNIPFPNILGNDREPGHSDFWAGELFDRGSPLHYSWYIGSAPLLLLLFGLKTPKRKLAQFLTSSIVLFFLLSLGHYSIFYPIIIKVPLLSAIFYPVKFIIGSFFSLSLLTALGFDHLFHSKRTQNQKTACVFVLATVSFVAFILCRDGVFRFFRRMFQITTEDSATELQQSFWHGMVLLMVYAAILFLQGLPMKPLLKAGFVFLALLMADLAYHNRHINPVIPEAFLTDRAILNPSTDPVRICREDFVPEALRPKLRTAEGAAGYYRRSLYPFCGMGDGIRYLNNEDRYFFCSSKYHSLLKAMAGTGRDGLVKVLRAQGCEYIVGHTPFPNLPCQTLDVQGHSLYVQEMGDSVPAAYIVCSLVRAQSLEEAFRILEEDGFDPRETAILGEELPFPLADGASSDKCEKIAVIKDTSSDKQFSVSLSRSGLLIVQGNIAPGWKAWVDSRPVPVLEAYPAARALQIPAGEHRVVLKYCPGSFKIGAAVTLFALFVLGLFLGLSLFGHRTKRTQKARG